MQIRGADGMSKWPVCQDACVAISCAAGLLESKSACLLKEGLREAQADCKAAHDLNGHFMTPMHEAQRIVPAQQSLVIYSDARRARAGQHLKYPRVPPGLFS